jgi:hypothetical protein
VHFIPLGINIGLDAASRLNAKPRELSVVYYDSDKSPWAAVDQNLKLAVSFIGDAMNANLGCLGAA